MNSFGMTMNEYGEAKSPTKQMTMPSKTVNFEEDDVMRTRSEPRPLKGGLSPQKGVRGGAASFAKQNTLQVQPMHMS